MKYHDGLKRSKDHIDHIIDETDMDDYMVNFNLPNNKITNTPKVLGIISFVISLAAVPYAYFMSSISVAMDRGYNSTEIFDLLNKKSPHVIAPIIVSILLGILVISIGVGVLVLSLISEKYFKISYIGFFICSLLYFLLIIPSKGASLFQFILCLIAGFIGYRNYKNADIG